MTVTDLLALFSPWGAPAVVALLILWAGFKKYWVWGWQLDEAQKRADKFERLALGNLHIAATATDAIVAERARGTGA